jgi:hypothetical protein
LDLFVVPSDWISASKVPLLNDFILYTLMTTIH